MTLPLIQQQHSVVVLDHHCCDDVAVPNEWCPDDSMSFDPKVIFPIDDDVFQNEEEMELMMMFSNKPSDEYDENIDDEDVFHKSTTSNRCQLELDNLLNDSIVTILSYSAEGRKKRNKKK